MTKWSKADEYAIENGPPRGLNRLHMVRKIFWEDAYRVVHPTRIAAVDRDRVRLEESIFFAFSGGQESDAGTIGGVQVLAAEKDGLDIVYTLPPDHGLGPGDEVDVRIDWERRYRLMRLHFAAEMVLQLIYKLRPGIERIGAHISADKARIDFALESNISRLFGEVEAELSALLRKDLPIVTDYSDLSAQRRYWEVEGFARMSCGGTHPRTTSEIGKVSLRRKNVGKGKERIEITLDPLK